MATTYKGAYTPVVSGDANVWGGYLNTLTFVTFDKALGGIANISLSSSNYVMSADESAMAIVRLTGTITANIQVTTLCQGVTWVENLTTGAYTVTFANGYGTPLAIPQGVCTPVITDTTNGPRNGSVILASDAELLAFSSAVRAVTPANMLLFRNHYRSLIKQSLTASSSTLNIDMANGWNVALTLSANVSTINVSNWPATGIMGRLVLEVTSTGAYNITGWPGTTIWEGGYAPTVTSGAGAKDTYAITTHDSGTNCRGYVASQNMG